MIQNGESKKIITKTLSSSSTLCVMNFLNFCVWNNHFRRKLITFNHFKKDVLCNTIACSIYYFIYENLSRNKLPRDILTGSVTGSIASCIVKNAFNKEFIFPKMSRDMTRNVPLELISYNTINCTKQIMKRYKARVLDKTCGELNSEELLMCGFLGGFVSVVLTQPIYAISNTIDACTKKKYQYFIKGFNYRLLSCGVSTCISYTVHNQISK